jgi:hypothetical protein
MEGAVPSCITQVASVQHKAVVTIVRTGERRETASGATGYRCCLYPRITNAIIKAENGNPCIYQGPQTKYPVPAAASTEGISSGWSAAAPPSPTTYSEMNGHPDTLSSGVDEGLIAAWVHIQENGKISSALNFVKVTSAY